MTKALSNSVQRNSSVLPFAYTLRFSSVYCTPTCVFVFLSVFSAIDISLRRYTVHVEQWCALLAQLATSVTHPHEWSRSGDNIPGYNKPGCYDGGPNVRVFSVGLLSVESHYAACYKCQCNSYIRHGWTLENIAFRHREAVRSEIAIFLSSSLDANKQNGCKRQSRRSFESYTYNIGRCHPREGPTRTFRLLFGPFSAPSSSFSSSVPLISTREWRIDGASAGTHHTSDACNTQRARSGSFDRGEEEKREQTQQQQQQQAAAWARSSQRQCANCGRFCRATRIWTHA